MTNTNRIKHQASMIEKRELALEWLTSYGKQITGKRDDAQVSVKITLFVAGSCEGSREATELMEAYSIVNLPEIIEQARQCCVNDIVIAREEILAALEIEA